ncbi:ComF family protein [Streptococcus sp. sy010]|uniref:ComF family protein n=1 Tax=Streptococcus sp. sy010 TaxID=2600148 RepID=UPI0011B799AD|nr:ComF family protein [Streptococcus sp. sy010]TWT14684.1 ComF family protein [Streptococcus sp. sy010]
MRCLLCDEALSSSFSFTDLFLLRPSKTNLCFTCSKDFVSISEKHCPSCYKSDIAELCSDCHAWQEQGKQVNHVALYRYNDAMKAYFSQYKFEGDYLLRKVFSQDIKQAIKKYKGYAFLPIPLSPEGLNKRRFNQVTGFLDEAGLPYLDLLGKHDSIKQSSKSRQERLASQQTFYLKKDKVLPDKILLIDDIYTTGATLVLAKQVLYQAGVRDIKTFSLAR